MSSRPGTFPPELWFMIAQNLQHDDNPQHISRLAQTSKWFHAAMNHLIYQPVRLQRRENARKLANTLSDRPDLKNLITEVRHYGDMGFHNFSYFCSSFYEELSTLKNLHTLIMRPKWRRKQVRWRHTWEYLLYDMYLDNERADWEAEAREFLAELKKAKQLGGPILDEEFEHGWNPLVDDSPRNYAFPPYYPEPPHRTLFCGDLLKESLPALRTCHIGTYSLQKRQDRLSLFFNCSIFHLSQLKTLCITGANYETAGVYPQHREPDDGSMTGLEELKLLNCRIDEEDLARILAYPAALKKLTLRGPNCSADDESVDGYNFVAEQLAGLHGSSLHSLDLEIYKGTNPPMDLSRLCCLTHLTVTPSTIRDLFLYTPLQSSGFLPPSLEMLSVRYEEGIEFSLKNLYGSVMKGGLPNLRTIVLQIHVHLILLLAPSHDDYYLEGEIWKSKFNDIGVNLEVFLLESPETMIQSDICPCENLEVYHQHPFHPHAPTDEDIEALHGSDDSDDSDDSDGSGDHDNPNDQGDHGDPGASDNPTDDDTGGQENDSVEGDLVEPDSDEGSPAERDPNDSNASVEQSVENSTSENSESDHSATVAENWMEEDLIEDSDDGFGGERKEPPCYLYDLAPRRLIHLRCLCEDKRDDWVNAHGYL